LILVVMQRIGFSLLETCRKTRRDKNSSYD